MSFFIVSMCCHLRVCRLFVSLWVSLVYRGCVVICYYLFAPPTQHILMCRFVLCKGVSMLHHLRHLRLLCRYMSFYVDVCVDVCRCGGLQTINKQTRPKKTKVPKESSLNVFKVSNVFKSMPFKNIKNTINI